jgi:hypothetical protein
MQYLRKTFEEVLNPLQAQVVVDTSGPETKLWIISHHFVNLEIRDRIKLILEMVRGNQLALDLDATYDFTFYPRTPSEWAEED